MNLFPIPLYLILYILFFLSLLQIITQEPAQFKLKGWQRNPTASPRLLRQVLFFKDISPSPHETQLRYRSISRRLETQQKEPGLEILLINLACPDFILIIVVFFNLFLQQIINTSSSMLIFTLSIGNYYSRIHSIRTCSLIFS